MRIAFNPSTVAALTTPPNNKDITFDLRGRNIFARGVKFQGTDTNTWRPVVDSLTSDSTTSSLSAKQGKILAGLINNKSDSGHNHDDRYIKKVGGIPTSAYDLIITPTNLSGDGYVDVGGGIHVKAHTGTPFQLWLHDTSNVWYKKTSDGAWKKMDAGYADIAGSVAWANVTGKPSSYTPSAHTHAWNSLTHSSTTANQAILTNGSVNGWKLYTLNISAWDNAANNAHSHSNKAILDGITSALVSSWNTAYNFVDKITKADTDKVINKWDEIVNFLAGIDSNNKLNTLLNSKLSIQQLAANDILTTKTNNALFWVNTVGTAGNIPTGPFTDHPYALLSVTNYSQNDTNGKFFYRSRLAFSSIGDIKVASCHHQNEYKQDETWYNVLTSKNSGISGSTIKLNGTSITVYSSGTADNRYVKKSGDTMTGALNFANGTWNLVGDDSYMGDCNISGHFGIKAANTTYPGIAFFNNASAFLGNLTAYSGNIKYGAYSLQFLDNGNTSVSSSTWTNPFSAYDSNAVADGQAICVWGQSSYLSNLTVDTGDMSLWLKRVNANVATLNMVLDGEYYAKGNQRLAHVSEIPSSLKNPYALTISLNGTSQGPYDGSAAKSINITAASIGAATSGHNHDERYYTKAESNTKYITDITTPVNKLTFTRNGSNIDRTITVNNVQSLGRRSPLTERNAISGIYTYGTYSNKNNLAPVNYFETLGFGEGTAGAIEIGGSWVSGGQLYWRALRDVQNNWFSWKTILDSSNYSGILDSRYYTEAEVNSLLSNKLNTSNFNWTNLPGKIVAGNEFNIVNAGFKEGIWFNYLPINDRSNPATINSYHFGNGNKGYTYIVASGFIKNGSNSSYVLLGDGGHQTISSLSVNYANSSGSATKVIVNQHTANDINYPLVWSNQSNTNSATENQLFKSWADLYYNPKNKRLCVAGSAIIGASAVPSYTLDVRGNIIAGTWLRTRGEGGWYSESYGGGICMWDTSWIRTYGNKGFYCDRQIYSSNSIRMNDIYLQNTNQINNGANGKLHLNYQNTGNVTICNGGGAVTIGSTSDDIGNNKLYVNGSEFINGASNVLNHVYADGFRHRSHNSNDSVLLAGGGYSQGVPVRYWAIYSVFIGNSSTDVTYTRRSGNYSFISNKSYEVEGVAIFKINFPSGYNKNNTLIFGNGDHRTSSNWRTPVYVTITTHNGFSINTNIRVMIADDYSFNAGFANIYFMCMG